MPPLDAAFSELPFRRLGEAALTRAEQLGATYADFRFERHKTQSISVRDTNLERLVDSDIVGYAVRVVHGGAWGFASSMVLTAEAAAEAAATAVAVAATLAPLNSEPVVLAAEPVYQATYVSSYEVDPFTVPDEEKVARADFAYLNDGTLAELDAFVSDVMAKLTAA